MTTGQQQPIPALDAMQKNCTRCGLCLRSCSFLQQYGDPATIAEKGSTPDNLSSAFECSLCGLCDAICPHQLPISSMMRSMRRQAQQQKLIDLKRYRPWLNYEKLGTSSPFRRDYFPPDCESVFFPGCSLPGTRPEAVHYLLKQLQQQEPNIGLVLDCCGKISHDLGCVTQFDQHAEKLVKRLQQQGIKRILTSCPGCTKILANYPADIQVESLYPLLSQQLQQSLPDNGETIAVHDPCPARFNREQQQAVRQLVRQCGYQIDELPSHGKYTLCCGQGGMVEGCVGGTVAKEAANIAQQAVGKKLISSCAACCDSLAAATTAVHIVDLLMGRQQGSSPSSARRWFNRFKLRWSRF